MEEFIAIQFPFYWSILCLADVVGKHENLNYYVLISFAYPHASVSLGKDREENGD